MYFSVKSVEPKTDYKLLITFETGEKKMFDMKPYLGTGVFKKLRDKDIFNTVRVSFNTIVWDDNIDFDPEALYEGGTTQSN